MAEIIKEDFSRQKCGVCHKRFATRYCDYVIQYPKSATFICGRTGYQDFVAAQRQITCDCALCDECAKDHGFIDFCPYHERIMQQEKINTPDYVKKSRGETLMRGATNETD